ncbi:hypothetical protein VTN77DRAFT_6387 [Rasamsonia byssochlamydoides]|uniref:uncharacterized protein n=1 Tax=Rasamsonia byssochlamydoides TaxID=89139 RepID=UPI00374480BD
MVDGTDGSLHDLEKAYCPPLDPALFNAIVSDFDLANPEHVKQLHETLDALKVTAEEQQDLPFDPSGTGGLGAAGVLDVDGIASERSASRNDTSGSRETDITSLQSDLSSLGIEQKDTKNRTDNVRRPSYIVSPNGSLSLTGMTVEEKTAYLTEMFPSVDVYTIKHTLMKCDNDVDRSMDVLLNLAFFEEQNPTDDGDKIFIPKGVDGFAEGSPGVNGKKKGKNRKQKVNNTLSGTSSPNSEAASPQSEAAMVNKWDAGKKDVEFICSRTFPVLQKEAVTSAYHSNGASLPATIHFLATSHAPKDDASRSDDPVTIAQVAELTQEFPTIPSTTLEGLLKITRNSVSAASELAAAMMVQPSSPQLSDIIRINAPTPVIDQKKPVRPPASPRVASDYDSAQNAARAHLVAGAEAFAKASAAYRRGKSDRLMGGAAAYYSAVGRDHIERAKRETSAAADALVDSQSTSDVLDLHGVSVQDAVRIASARVSQWWDSLGDAKYAPGGGAARTPYRIVTGVGRHSRDGTSRLGPAVGKMLVREGWRVEVGEGVLTVTGMVRRR